MFTLKVPSKLFLSCWFSRSNFQQQVVRHAICCGTAWYAYVSNSSAHILTHVHCAALSIAGIICQHFDVLCESSPYNIHFASLYLDTIDFIAVRYI